MSVESNTTPQPIEEPILDTVPTTPAPTSLQPNHKKLIFLIIGLFVLVILTFALAAGIFFYKDASGRSQETLIPTKKMSSLPTQTNFQTSPATNLKTYENGKYSFSYPADMFIFEYQDTDYTVLVSDIENPNDIADKKISPEGHTFIQVNFINFPMTLHLPSSDGSPTKADSYTSPNGYTGIRGKYSFVTGPGDIVYLRKDANSHGAIIYEIGDKSAFDQILSTFKFTNSQTNTACMIAGCSNSLCVSEDKARDLVSTCEYKETYACYKTAKCEQQKNGECGWTQTEELTSCLKNPGN